MPLGEKTLSSQKGVVPTPLRMMRGGWFYHEPLPVFTLQPLGGTSAVVTALKNQMTEVRGFLLELERPGMSLNGITSVLLRKHRSRGRDGELDLTPAPHNAVLPPTTPA